MPVLKAQLKGLLAEPLLARGVSARYPTSGSKVIVDDLIAASGMSFLLSGHVPRTSLRGNEAVCWCAAPGRGEHGDLGAAEDYMGKSLRKDAEQHLAANEHGATLKG